MYNFVLQFSWNIDRIFLWIRMNIFFKMCFHQFRFELTKKQRIIIIQSHVKIVWSPSEAAISCNPSKWRSIPKDIECMNSVIHLSNNPRQVVVKTAIALLIPSPIISLLNQLSNIKKEWVCLVLDRAQNVVQASDEGQVEWLDSRMGSKRLFQLSFLGERFRLPSETYLGHRRLLSLTRCASYKPRETIAFSSSSNYKSKNVRKGGTWKDHYSVTLVSLYDGNDGNGNEFI